MIIPTCAELVAFLDAYIERRLRVARRLALQVHPLGCRNCRAYS